MTEYPLLTMTPLTHAERRQQTRREARKYFNWLMSVREERVRHLLSFLEEGEVQDAQVDLLRIGEKFQGKIWEGEFSEYLSSSGKQGLSERGYALSSDMGLLIAELIQQQRPHVGWDIEKRKLITYNAPVLTGFPIMNPDPVGSAVARAFSVLRGLYQADAWWILFDKWMEHTAETAPAEKVKIP